MVDGRGGRSSPPTNQTIRDADWDSRDLLQHSYDHVEFVDVDMTEVDNVGTAFAQCVFRNVKFNASRHSDAAFVNCTLTACSFFDATFTRCKLVGSTFERCSFSLLKVSGGDWSFVGFAGADLRNASFTDVRMRECELTGARCAGMTLRNADLSGAFLHNVDFAGADLRGSDLSALDPFAAHVKGAIVDDEQAVAVAIALGLDVRLS